MCDLSSKSDNWVHLWKKCHKRNPGRALRMKDAVPGWGLTSIYTPFSFSTYYTKLSINYLFEALNKFKLKICQLQSFIIFEIYNFHFGTFSIRCCLRNLNFEFQKFKHTFRWEDDFKLKKFQLQSCSTSEDQQLLF